MTNAGTDTAPLLLDKLTLSPPLGATPLNVTVHASVPDPAIHALLQDRAPSTEEVDVPATEFNFRANICEALPLVAVSITDCAELTDETFAEKLALVELAGTVTDAGTDTAPLLLDRLTLSPPLGAELLNLTVHVSVPDPVIDALLQDRALSTDEVGVSATEFNCRAKICEAVPFEAVSITACAELTDDTVAVNSMLVELAGTVTEAGTITAPLLLERLTLSPPLGAELLNVTVHASVPDPVIDALLQDRALSVDTVEADASPLPCSFTLATTELDVRVMTLSCPVASVAAFGVKCILTLRVPPAGRVIGRLRCPSTENEGSETLS